MGGASYTSVLHDAGKVPWELWLRRREERVRRVVFTAWVSLSELSVCSAEKSESSVPSELLQAVLWGETTTTKTKQGTTKWSSSARDTFIHISFLNARTEPDVCVLHKPEARHPNHLGSQEFAKVSTPPPPQRGLHREGSQRTLIIYTKIYMAFNVKCRCVKQDNGLKKNQRDMNEKDKFTEKGRERTTYK